MTLNLHALVQITLALVALGGPSMAYAQCRRATVSGALAAGATQTRTASCIAGETAAGGGFSLGSNALVIHASESTSSLDGWNAVVENTDNSNAHGFDVIAACCPVTCRRVAVSGALAAGATQTRTASCIAGETAAGGGFSLGSNALVIHASKPTPSLDGWNAVVENTDNSNAHGFDVIAACCTVVPQVDLAVTKNESIDPVVVGSGPSDLTYVVTITNNGPSAASGVELNELLTLPAGVTIDSITPSAGSFGGTRWSLGGLANRASETLTVVLSLDSSTGPGLNVISDTATLTNVNETDTNPANDSASESTSVARAVDLAVTKSESIDPVRPGNMAYVVTVTNNGPFDASGVEISEALTLPAGVAVDSITPSAGSFGGTTWSVGNLVNGASETLTIDLTVGSLTVPGPNIISGTAALTNVNEVDTNPSNDSASESTSVAGPTCTFTESEFTGGLNGFCNEITPTFGLLFADFSGGEVLGFEWPGDLKDPPPADCDSLCQAGAMYVAYNTDLRLRSRTNLMAPLRNPLQGCSLPLTPDGKESYDFCDDVGSFRCFGACGKGCVGCTVTVSSDCGTTPGGCSTREFMCYQRPCCDAHDTCLENAGQLPPIIRLLPELRCHLIAWLDDCNFDDADGTTSNKPDASCFDPAPQCTTPVEIISFTIE